MFLSHAVHYNDSVFMVRIPKMSGNIISGENEGNHGNGQIYCLYNTNGKLQIFEKRIISSFVSCIVAHLYYGDIHFAVKMIYPVWGTRSLILCS